MEDLQTSPGRPYSTAPAAEAKPGESLTQRLLGGHRLLLVSNREPYVRKRTADGVRFERTAGGLVSALDPVMRGSGGVWVAWQPDESPELESRYQVPGEAPQFTLRQVPLTQREVAGYYHGFANRALWPLFHYFVDRCRFDEEEWRQYERINERFARVVVEEAAPGDVVWVHDYHFCLLPRKIRERRPDGGPLAFFLHIPFPTEEVFRVLPWRRQVLTGLLGADLVGFHTEDYAGDFLGCCQRLLGAEVDHARHIVRWEGREVRLGAFPIGIDPRDVPGAAGGKTVEELASGLPRPRQAPAGARCRPPRLHQGDPGAARRLRAAARVSSPSGAAAVSLMQISVPSRGDVPEYAEQRERIEKIVGRTNGEYGDADWVPVRYMYRSFGRGQLSLLYRNAAVGYVTPLRDGMNLVAKEYCCLPAGPRWRAGALRADRRRQCPRRRRAAINPFAVEETAEALAQALAMPAEERRRRMERLQARVEACDVHGWLATILAAVVATRKGMPARAGGGDKRGAAERPAEQRGSDARRRALH